MGKLVQPQEAVLKLKRVYFDEITYKYFAEKNSNRKYAFSFEKNMEEFDSNQYKICLKCNINNEDNTTELHVQVVGEFECSLEEGKFKSDLLNENAIAILFPYLRSQICLVTTQPEQAPINLPAINILSLFNKN